MATLQQREVAKKFALNGLKQIKERNLNPEHFKYLYIFKCKEFYKIGYTYNLLGRFESVRMMNPFELEIVFAAKIPQARDFEQTFHESLKEYRIRGEWFKLPAGTVEKFKERLLDVIWEEADKNNAYVS